MCALSFLTILYTITENKVNEKTRRSLLKIVKKENYGHVN